jgi:hypothetical protein
MFLLDTNLLSETRKGPKMDPHVAAWDSSVRPDAQFVSVIVLLEIEKGILLLERRDPLQAKAIRSWFEDKLLPGLIGRILDIDAGTALRAATLHVPDPRPDNDALIAATALVHGLTVVTRNTADFAGMGVATLNPWSPAT